MNTYDDGNDENLSMAITTALLENQTPIAPDAVRKMRIRKKLLAAVHAEKIAEVSASDDFATGIFDANGLYTVRAQEGEWVKMNADIEVKLLRGDMQSRSYLMRLYPGARVPPHLHVEVDEECYVLEGEARIGNLHLRAGDFHLAPRGVPHDWLCTDAGALLLLRADSRTQFLELF